MDELTDEEKVLIESKLTELEAIKKEGYLSLQ